jgi:hypothetical protein
MPTQILPEENMPIDADRRSHVNSSITFKHEPMTWLTKLVRVYAQPNSLGHNYLLKSIDNHLKIATRLIDVCDEKKIPRFESAIMMIH